MAPSLGTVAVVDDDPSVREALCQLLQAAHYRTQSFASAEEFLASGGVARIDCLIADVHLPGMTGVALVTTLAAAGAAPPTVLITARDDGATRELRGAR